VNRSKGIEWSVFVGGDYSPTKYTDENGSSNNASVALEPGVVDL
jgi:hypothetical protein